MKKLLQQKYLLALLAFFVLSVEGMGQFTLSAEVRPRTEFRNGFKTPTAKANDPAFFTEQRSRLYLDFKQDKYKFKLALQDVRIWGENPQIFKEEDGNSFLSEAWGQFYINDAWSFKVGRQIISYDNQRFLGGLEWAQQGRRHDALLIINENKEKKTKFHAGFAFNADDDVAEPAYLQSPTASFYSVGGNYKSLQYGWFNKGFDDGSQFSLLALNASSQISDTETASKQTIGLFGKIAFGNAVLGGDVYYQTGKSGVNNVNALLAGLNVTFKTQVTPLTLGFEYISGKDDDDLSTDVTNFSPDFGTNHAHNGFMDYFFVGPANGNVGVIDLYLKSKFKLKKGALVAHVHEFLTGSRQLNPDGNELDKAMGLEIDLVLVKPLTNAVTLNIGFSQLFATDTMKSLRPGDATSNNWAWLMFTFKPELFTTKEQ